MVTVWIAGELGVLQFGDLMAEDAPGAIATKNVNEEGLSKAALVQRERQLKEKEQLLLDQVRRRPNREVLLSKEVEVQKKEITDLKALLAKYELESNQKTNAFVQIFEKMDGKRVAKIFDELEVGLASSMIRQLKQDKAAEVLGKMNPDKAKQVTEIALIKKGFVATQKK